MSKDDEIKQLKRLLGQLVATCRRGSAHKLWQQAADVCHTKATNQWKKDSGNNCQLRSRDDYHYIYADEILAELKRLEDLVEAKQSDNRIDLQAARIKHLEEWLTVIFNLEPMEMHYGEDTYKRLVETYKRAAQSALDGEEPKRGKQR